MKTFSSHLNEALTKFNNPNHAACVKTLLDAGFEQGKKDTVTRDGVSYVVRAHKMPVTHAGRAIIVDYFDFDKVKCPNMIFIDPDRANNTICLVDRQQLCQFVNNNSSNRKMMWLTGRDEDPQNMGKSTCFTIPLKSMEGQDWFKMENI